MSVGTLEEMIDENHAIVASSVGPEYYVNIMSFVDKDQLEPGSSVLLHNKVKEFMCVCMMYVYVVSFIYTYTHTQRQHAYIPTRSIFML